MKISHILTMHSIAALALFYCFCGHIYAQPRTPFQLYEEVENYTKERQALLVSQGKKIDAARRDAMADEKKALAKNTRTKWLPVQALHRYVSAPARMA